MNLDTLKALQECVTLALAEHGCTRISQLRVAYAEFVVPKGCDADHLKAALDMKLAARGLYTTLTVRRSPTQTRIRLTYKT